MTRLVHAPGSPTTKEARSHATTRPRDSPSRSSPSVAVACGGGRCHQRTRQLRAVGGRVGTGRLGVAIAAKDLAFDKTTLTAKADTAFQIDFDDREYSPAQRRDQGRERCREVRGRTSSRATKITYNVAALPAGAYASDLRCTPT